MCCDLSLCHSMILQRFRQHISLWKSISKQQNHANHAKPVAYTNIYLRYIILYIILLHDPYNFWFCQDTSFSMLLLWVTSVVASSPAKWRSLESWALKNMWRKNKWLGNEIQKWNENSVWSRGKKSSVLGYTLMNFLRYIGDTKIIQYEIYLPQL